MYDALVAMTGLEPIKKELKKYQLPDGHILECCNVDPGTENNFMYAEVEFEDEDTAPGDTLYILNIAIYQRTGTTKYFRD